MTKNDIYALLIRQGIALGYEVIPEFRVDVLPESAPIKKNLDLVWAVRRAGMPPQQDRRNLDYWELVAAFEIEGCDVRSFVRKAGRAKATEFDRHVAHFPLLENLDTGRRIYKAIVLYTQAYDRHWNNLAPADYRDRQIGERQEWGRAADIAVIDARASAWVSDVSEEVRKLRS